MAFNENKGFFWKIINILFSPQNFFETVSKESGFDGPILFVIIIGLIIGSLVSALIIFALNILAGVFPPLAQTFQQPLWLIVPIIIAVSMIGLVIVSFIGALVSHLSIKILGGQGTFNDTYKIIAYSTALIFPTAIITPIPIAGQFVPAIWSILINVFGFSILHNVSKARAFGAMLLSYFLFTVATIGLIFVLAPLLPATPENMQLGQINEEAFMQQVQQQNNECMEESPGNWCYSIQSGFSSASGCGPTEEMCLNDYNQALSNIGQIK